MQSCLLATAIFAADRVCKKASQEKKEYKGRFIRFTYSENAGAFLRLGENNSNVMKWLSGVMTAGVLCATLRAYGIGETRLLKTALCLLTGGALSNTLDRFKDGFVTDYVQFRKPDGETGKVVYNLADFSVFAGAGLLLLTVK